MLIEPGKKLTTFERILVGFQMSWQVGGIILAIVVLIEYAIRVGPKIFAFCYRVLGAYGAQGGMAALVIVCGVAAHWFKRRNQHWHGTVEVLLGTLSGIHICFTLAPGVSMFSQWVALAGCTYVITRRLNNIAEANEKKTTVSMPVLSTNP